jgi:hypothetical protein
MRPAAGRFNYSPPSCERSIPPEYKEESSEYEK